MPRLSFLALKAADPGRSAAFYATLGFVFQPERHGEGSLHMASLGEQPVLEIYPAAAGDRPGSGLIGVEVATALGPLSHRLESLGGTCLAPRPCSVPPPG